MHQVGFSLNDYIEMHGQQNIKTLNLLLVQGMLFVLSVLQTIVTETLKEGMTLT